MNPRARADLEAYDATFLLLHVEREGSMIYSEEDLRRFVRRATNELGGNRPDWVCVPKETLELEPDVFSLPLREGPLGVGFLIEPKLYTVAQLNGWDTTPRPAPKKNITYRFAETGGLVYTVEKTQ